MSEIVVTAEALKSALKAVDHAWSRDYARPILTGVLLSARDGKLYAVAGDNYRLAEAQIEVHAGDPSMVGERETVIAGESIAVLFAFLKSTPSGALVRVALNDGALMFTTGGYGVMVRLIDGQYPAYLKAFPKAAPAVFGINPAYLADAGRVLKKIVGPGAVRVQSSGPLDPVLLEAEGYREAIMPVRIIAATELCKAPAGTYDGVEGGRPHCPVPCPHEVADDHHEIGGEG